MKTVGIIGSRGLVGSVLMKRMKEENDFQNIEPIFFSTTKIGKPVPQFEKNIFYNALDVNLLSELDIILTCQGSEYTQKIHPLLRKNGWQGYWIDAASYLRMKESSLIVLDPLNKVEIQKSLNNGTKDFIGGNCVTSLMLMALAGLFKANLIEWMTTATYQASSGAGAKAMQTLIEQSEFVNTPALNLSEQILKLDQQITQRIQETALPTDNINAALIYNLIPWIDKGTSTGQTKEEQKVFLEANKILNPNKPISLDSVCVRIATMRCHSQAFTIKLKKDINLNEIENMISQSHKWIKLIPNQKTETIKQLTPASVSGTLEIAIGRIRKLNIGNEYLTAFTVGDQLLWGAAEPLRRTLNLILN